MGRRGVAYMNSAAISPKRPGNAALLTLLGLFCLALPFRVHAIEFSERVYLTPYDLVMGAAILGLLVRVIDRRQHLQFPLWQAACLLFAGQLLSLGGGVTVYGVGALKILLTDFAVFYLALNIPRSEQQARRLIFFAIVVAGAISVWSVVDVGLGNQDLGFFLSHGSRRAAAASFEYGSQTAAFLLVAVPFALITVLEDKSRLRVWVALIAVVAMTAAITLADIRSALLAYLVAVVPFMRSRKTILKMAGVLLIGFLALYALDPIIFDAIVLRTTMQGPTATSDVSNVVTRLIAWQNCLQLWVKHPLFGVGVANWRYAWMNAENAMFVLPIAQPHNVFMELLAETGVVGLVTYVFFFGRIAVILRRIKLMTKDPWVRGIAKATLVAIAAAFVVSSFNGDLPYGDQVTLLLFLLLGLTLRSAQLRGAEIVPLRSASPARLAPGAPPLTTSPAAN